MDSFIYTGRSIRIRSISSGSQSASKDSHSIGRISCLVLDAWVVIVLVLVRFGSVNQRFGTLRGCCSSGTTRARSSCTIIVPARSSMIFLWWAINARVKHALFILSELKFWLEDNLWIFFFFKDQIKYIVKIDIERFMWIRRFWNIYDDWSKEVL